MKSKLRGGKPRDMATMSHGGMTSRGAGAAQRGFNYNLYAEGGKVDSRKGRVRAFDLEGREIPWPPSKEDYSKPPAGKIEYDEGGKRIRGYDKDTDAEIEWPPSRRNMDKPPVNLRKDTGKPISASPNREYAKGGKVKKYEEGGEVDREVRRPAFAKEMLPTRPTSQQRRMARRAPPPAPPRPSDTDVMRGIVKDMTREERVRKAEMPSEIYRKGGGVKMAGGGSCRGMGAATKGGKYTIK